MHFDERPEHGLTIKTMSNLLGERIDGLHETPDGRRKIAVTAERFTEQDEFTAVAQFKQRAAVTLWTSRGKRGPVTSRGGLGPCGRDLSSPLRDGSRPVSI